MELFFDTETSGFISKKIPLDDIDNAYTVQLAAILSDKDRIYQELNLMIRADGRKMNPFAQDVHGISAETSNIGGITEAQVLDMFAVLLNFNPTKVCHNIVFDLGHLDAILARNTDVLSDFTRSRYYLDLPEVCTMKSTIDFCNLPFPSGKKGKKFPKLEELYFILFEEELQDAHDALIDVRATRRCYYKLIEEGII